MKSIKKVSVLALAVSGIILCWLMPLINTASDVRYTRMYEATDKKPKAKRAASRATEARKPDLPAKKVYKTESILPKAGFDSIKPYMFSRAVQFTNHNIIDTDSLVEEQQLVVLDSMAVYNKANE